MTIADQTFEKVGIRYKGNGTIMDAARTAKKSIKIDLDRAGGSGRFGGSKSINLHCEVTDPTKCREVLGYAIYRAAGVPAPRTALAEVWLAVPGKFDKELLGVYTLVEEVDKLFLKDRFGGDKGVLMKPEGLREFEDRGDDWSKYQAQYAPKREPTRDEAERVIAFAKLVRKGDDATFKRDIGSYLDVDNYLRFLAATVFVANGDCLFFGHNYCPYLNPRANKLYLVPWDLDRAFANFPVLGSNSQQVNLSLMHPYPGTHRLTDRLLAIPEISLDVERVGIWLLTDERCLLRCVDLFERGKTVHSAGATMRVDEFPEYLAALGRRKTLPAENVVVDPRTTRLADAYLAPLGITSKLDAPIYVGGEMIGVLCHEHIGAPREWTTEQRDFAGSMADVLALGHESENGLVQTAA